MTGKSENDLGESKDAHKSEDIQESEEIDQIPQGMISKFSMLLQSGPFPPQLYEKITPNHITTILEHSGNDDERAYEFARSDRKYRLFYVLLATTIFRVFGHILRKR